MIKVMIADDQALIRESLQIILSAHHSYAQDGWCDGDKRSQGTLP